MGRLASQSAAHKLVHIVGLLVVPIVALLSLYFITSKTEIDAYSQERAGVALARFVIDAPVEMSATALQNLRQLERLAGVQTKNELIVSSNRWSKKTLSDYLARVGVASRVTLDAEPNVQALATVVFDLVPTYTQKFEAMASTAATGQASLKASGDLQAVLRGIEDNLGTTQEFRTAKISQALQAFHDADKALQVAVTTLADEKSNSEAQQIQFEILRSHAQVLSDEKTTTLQMQLLDRIDKHLSNRISNDWRKLLLVIFAGLASATLGIGFAVIMIRSTLLRLDEVELAHKEAQVAKAEAETITARFTAINADISRLNQDLALKVGELKAAQDELIKKGRMEQLGQLIATIAHEVRNPLGAIRTTAFMMERKIADKNLGLEGHIQRINNSVHRCDTIIAQLLDYSRTREVNSTPMNLDDWLAKVVREEAARLPENILIECALGLEGETVAIDPVRMQRAVVNLLNNASEALVGQQDRGTSGSQLHHHIWVSTKTVGDFAVIRVADNGPGIAAEYIQKIREPLYTTKSFGTGLGIPAVEQVVMQHGGRLDISSDIGKGAVFSLHLPLQHKRGKAA